MSEIRLIDANALKEHKFLTPQVKVIGGRHNGKMREQIIEVYGKGWNDCIDAIIDNAPTVAVDNYAMGYQDGVRQVLSERPQGEITDEDIQNAIKQGYKDGYAMARAKFERPKGDIEFAKWVADQIFFKEVKDDLFVELACRKLEKLGLVEKTESEWILRGGGENEIKT